MKRNTSVKWYYFPYYCFFYKQQGNVREVVYMTAITQSDKGLSDTLLGLVDVVLGKFRRENPYITNMYIKSENAASHQRNFAASMFIKSVNPKVQSLCIMITMSFIHCQVLFYFAAG